MIMIYRMDNVVENNSSIKYSYIKWPWNTLIVRLTLLDDPIFHIILKMFDIVKFSMGCYFLSKIEIASDFDLFLLSMSLV